MTTYLGDLKPFYKTIVLNKLPDTTEYKPRFRIEVIRWMNQVFCELVREYETFHLAVYYFDTYISKTPVKKDDIQLVIMSAMIIAMKVNEEYIYDIDYLLKYCLNAYSKQQIIDMESSMINVLEFRLHPITVFNYICSFVELIQEENMHMLKETFNAIEFIKPILDIMNILVADQSFGDYSYVHIAASILMILNNNNPWLQRFYSHENIETEFIVEIHDIMPCIFWICDLFVAIDKIKLFKLSNSSGTWLKALINVDETEVVLLTYTKINLSILDPLVFTKLSKESKRSSDKNVTSSVPKRHGMILRNQITTVL